MGGNITSYFFFFKFLILDFGVSSSMRCCSRASSPGRRRFGTAAVRITAAAPTGSTHAGALTEPSEHATQYLTKYQLKQARCSIFLVALQLKLSPSFKTLRNARHSFFLRRLVEYPNADGLYYTHNRKSSRLEQGRRQSKSLAEAPR